MVYWEDPRLTQVSETLAPPLCAQELQDLIPSLQSLFCCLRNEKELSVPRGWDEAIHGSFASTTEYLLKANDNSHLRPQASLTIPSESQEGHFQLPTPSPASPPPRKPCAPPWPCFKTDCHLSGQDAAPPSVRLDLPSVSLSLTLLVCPSRLAPLTQGKGQHLDGHSG